MKLNMTLGRGKKKETLTPPTKTTLNLAIKEKSDLDPRRAIPAVILVVLLVALLGKFAVFDRYAALNEAEAKLANEKATLSAMQAAYSDYDEVKQEYNRYSYSGFDRTIPDRQAVLALLEREAFPVSGMRQMSISGRTLSMTLVGMTLEQISQLVNRLDTDELVESVFVYTAGYGGVNDQTGEPTATFTITLADATTLPGAVPSVVGAALAAAAQADAESGEDGGLE